MRVGVADGDRDRVELSDAVADCVPVEVAGAAAELLPVGGSNEGDNDGKAGAGDSDPDGDAATGDDDGDTATAAGDAVALRLAVGDGDAAASPSGTSRYTRQLVDHATTSSL